VKDIGAVVTASMKLAIVVTHPVQYLSPWFRFITESCPDIDLTVVYGAIPAAEQQGVGFGQAFAWDIPLTEGYRAIVCGDSKGKSFDSSDFFGVDAPDIERHLVAMSPDVVLVPGWHSAMQVRAIRACRRHGIPVMYRGDSTLFSGPRRWVRPLWRLKSRYMLSQFDGYLAVGAHADEYLRQFCAADSPIVRSPHCVDNDRFRQDAGVLRTPESRARLRAAIGASADDFVVLFAGKFQPRKRPLDAVRAVARLGSSAVLMMVGDGPLAAEARAEAERGHVRLAWQGFLNQSQLPAAFAAADVLLVPSSWESWGLVVNEALASGVPCVVTTRVACAPDLIVDGVTGFTAEPLNIERMAARLMTIRDAQREGHNFGPACYKQADTCSFAAATSGLRALCGRLSRRSEAVGFDSITCSETRS
jgi:glycosyltransferase involved in cell wall biosynthesis